MVTLSGTRSTDLTGLQYPRTGLASLWAYSMERDLLMMQDVIKAELLQLRARRMGGRDPYKTRVPGAFLTSLPVHYLQYLFVAFKHGSRLS